MLINKQKSPSNYQNGDIVLSYEKAFTSWVIRKMTSSQWSHAGIIFDSSSFVSAVPMQGVCSRPLAIVENRAIYRVKNLLPEQIAQLRAFCFSKIGAKYDMTQVFVLGWRIITNTVNKYGDDAKPNKFECLEFVGEAFDSIGIRFGKYVDNLLPNMITKSNLVALVE